jgi:branched-chain amino acid transport system substrate-binding protein
MTYGDKMTFNKLGLGIALMTALSASAQETVVKIGHTGPLTGPQAYSGKDNENGVRLAIEELNAKAVNIGGKKIKFELMSEDDQADPKTGVLVAQKLIDSGVKFVTGPVNSGVAIPASRAYNEAGVILATVATNPKVTEPGYKNLFRVMASDSMVGSLMATYAAKELKLKTVAVIDDRTAYGQGLAEEFKKNAKSAGLNIVAHEYTNDKATDFTAILTSIKSKKVDGIFFGGYTPQGAPMAQQMKKLAINAKLLGGDICSHEMGKLGGDAVGDNVYCAQGGAILDKVAAGPAFRAKYKKRYNQDPDLYAPSYYDAMYMIYEAMQKTGSTDPQKVGAEIRKLSYKGIAGTYTFDQRGEMTNPPMTVFTFKNSEPFPIKSYGD